MDAVLDEHLAGGSEGRAARAPSLHALQAQAWDQRVSSHELQALYCLLWKCPDLGVGVKEQPGGA